MVRKNAIEMYSTQNEGKSVIAERIIRSSKNKIYKYMTSISKNVYIDKLNNIVHKYNNTYHNTIKIKPVDIKSNAYIKLVIMLEYQNVKTFLQKVKLQIGLKKFL